MTKEEKENLERQYISDFEVHFIEQKLDINNPEEINYIKEKITNVARLEIEELGYKLEGEEQQGEKTFKIEWGENENSFELGYQSWENIKFNLNGIIELLKSEDEEERKEGCIHIFQTVFHEIQHQRQDMLARMRGVPTKSSMLYAKEAILHNVLEDSFYTANYHRFGIEDDAKSTGYGQYINLMDLKNADVEYLRDFYRLSFELAVYSKGETVDKFEKKFELKDSKTREDVFEEIMAGSNVVGEMDLLAYPILQKEYKMNGHWEIVRRDTVELIQNMKKEIEDITAIQYLDDKNKSAIIDEVKEAYYEMIYRSIKEEMSLNINDFKYLERTRLDNDTYKSLLKAEYIRNGIPYGDYNAVINTPKEIKDEIEKNVIEKYSESNLKQLMEALGKDEFNELMQEMKEYLKKELNAKTNLNMQHQRLDEARYPDEAEEIQSEIKAYEDYLEQYYGEKLEFLTSIGQRAEEITLDSPIEAQEECTLTPKTIQAGTMEITKSEIDLVIRQIRNMQIKKNKKIDKLKTEL